MSDISKFRRGIARRLKHKTSKTEQVTEPDQERRDALVKIGRFGAYTAPGLLVLLTSERAVASDSAE